MTTPLLDVRGLSTSFALGGLFKKRRLRAVHEVSFTVDRGEIVALVGESGSGKSTIARLIARLVPATAGEVYLDGQEVLTGTVPLAYRRRVQMIFQDPFGSLNPAHTILHHIARPLLRHGRARSASVRAEALLLLDTVGLRPAEDFIDAHPHSLSGGQRQRVAIARALATSPELLLADEPTSMLDVSIRMEVLALLKRLRDERGLAIIFITHDLAAARFLADRVLVLYAGQLVEEAPAGELMDDPKHPYSQLLMAAVPRPGRALTDPLPGRSGKPDVINPPPGCPYASRCPSVTARCETTAPPMHQLSKTRRARCHLLEDEIS